MTEPAKNSEVCSRMRKTLLEPYKNEAGVSPRAAVERKCRAVWETLQSLGRVRNCPIYGPVVKRLRRRPLTPKTRVRFPAGSPFWTKSSKALTWICKLNYHRLNQLLRPPKPHITWVRSPDELIEICGTKEWKTRYPKKQSKLAQANEQTNLPANRLSLPGKENTETVQVLSAV